MLGRLSIQGTPHMSTQPKSEVFAFEHRVRADLSPAKQGGYLGDSDRECVSLPQTFSRATREESASASSLRSSASWTALSAKSVGLGKPTVSVEAPATTSGSGFGASEAGWCKQPGGNFSPRLAGLNLCQFKPPRKSAVRASRNCHTKSAASGSTTFEGWASQPRGS